MDQNLDENLLNSQECDSDVVIVIEKNGVANAEKEGVADEASANAGKARGCLMGQFGHYFTDDPEPRKLKSAVCKHCHTKFNHQRKSEQAEAHVCMRRFSEGNEWHRDK
ncbi:unnamed protein product [Lampetra planeri]